LTLKGLEMMLLKNPNDLQLYLEKQRKQGEKTGFVPTMGALHEGHVSLIRASNQSGNLTVCSIFINPTQFNDPSDFDKYPVTIEKDIRLLASEGCDVLFLPSVPDMYPDGTNLTRTYDLGYLDTILEGSYRPGHFQGVATIVDSLLQMVKPDHLYIGQKDYQQCMVIKKLITMTGMENLITLHISPTLREPGGLAMSSRNTRLDKESREKAVAIFQTLQFVKQQIKKGDLVSLKAEAVQRLASKGFDVDYIEIADATTLEPVNNWDGSQNLVTLAAAYLNGVRLIDNILLN
jgi:pantoate--beta-alanine ligase